MSLVVTRCPECNIEAVYPKKKCPKNCYQCGKKLNRLDQTIKPLTESDKVKQEGRY